MPTLDLRHSSSPDEIRDLARRGYEPVECSIGGSSIVGPLRMDHHGELSHLEGVAIRAYRDHAGARTEDPRFVVTGRADADATFAIAALAGRLPPRAEKDLTALADLVNRADTSPIGLDFLAEAEGPKLLLFNALAGGHTAEDFVFGVGLWSRLARGVSPSLLAAAEAGERERLEAAKSAPVLFEEGGVRLLESPGIWGFDVWYGPPSGDPGLPSSWARPVVLTLDRGRGDVTVGCPNAAVAEALFGSGGLKNVFPRLAPAGWGGREAIGGSPRGVRLSVAEAIAAARALAGFAP